jgi:putative flippase GtrA
MAISPGVMERLRSPGGQKLLRYSAASVVSVVVSVVFLVLFDGVFGWPAVVSSTLATAIATVPSYELNRKWAWGKAGKSHLWKEVVPFWALAFLGWAISTVCVDAIETYAMDHHYGHVLKTLVVTVVYVGAFGVLWVAKFVIFNKVLFVHRHHDHAGAAVAGDAKAFD